MVEIETDGGEKDEGRFECDKSVRLRKIALVASRCGKVRIERGGIILPQLVSGMKRGEKRNWVR